MLIKSEQLSVGSLIKNVMLKYLFWASYILRLCAQTCTPNRHALIKSWILVNQSDIWIPKDTKGGGGVTD